MTWNSKLGSIWRRWDLHIHTIDTVKNNQFNCDWEDYIKKIEDASDDISVIGITDYFRIEGYKTLFGIKNSGRMNNIDLIIPNIEFRLSVAVGKKNQLLNIHLLVNPNDPDHIEEIESALAQFFFESDEAKYPCNDAGFIKLGKKRLGKGKDDGAYLKEGIEKFCPSFESFREWYRENKWLRENSMIVVANGSNDGISGIAPTGARSEIRDEILRLSDAIFSGKPNDRDYYLGKGVDSVDDLENRIKGTKPCIHGSDAHKLEELFEPDEQRYCWIKADPTFEGLKQIIFEPEDRVFVGKTPPESKYHDKTISKIILNRSPNWYGLESLEINPGYVAIIGNKGSGKTALADCIAYATEAWEPKNKGSFIKKASKEMAGTEIKVEWADKHPTKKTISIKDYKSEDVQIRYLSQEFVENLCSEDRLGEALRDEIEKVVFSHIDETEQLGASNFFELRKKKTISIVEQRLDSEENLSKNIASYVSAAEEMSSRSEKLQRRARLTNDITNVKKEIPKQTKEGENLTNQITNLRNQETQLVRNISLKKQEIETYKQEIQKLIKLETGLSQRVQELSVSLKELGVSDSAIQTLPSFDKKIINNELHKKIDETSKEVDDLTGSTEDLSDVEINKILSDEESYQSVPLKTIKILISFLERKETEDSEKRKKINKAIKDTQELQSKIKLIDDEIKRLDELVTKNKQTALNNMLARYRNIFEAYEHEEDQLEELYAPLKDRLSGGAEYEQRLTFYIQRDVDHRAWCERGYGMFDTRKIKQTELGTIEEFKEYVEDHLFEAWQANDLPTVSEHIQKILAKLEKSAPIIGLIKSSYSEKDIYEWLFSTEHIKMMYGMRYDGVTLEKLSPGTKGVILLMLYLEMDKNDCRPLVVDQPEENLDNESVFTILTHYFREAKKRRQIIVITHNPNLVLNTDADQIIIAKSEEDDDLNVRKISYISGSIENTRSKEHPSIRELTCNILEGGDKAFSKRERRYAMRH